MLGTLGPNDPSAMDAYRDHMVEREAYLQYKNECYSLWTTVLRCITLAHVYRREKAIYFPHNIDFRGRVYPLAPYLNHMGGDLVR